MDIKSAPIHLQIKALMKLENLKNGQLAGMLGLSQSYVSMMLTHKKSIKLEYLEEMCRILGYRIVLEKIETAETQSTDQ